MYEKHNNNNSKTKIYWHCKDFYQSRRAKVHPTFNCSEPKFILLTGSHSHPTITARVNA